MAPSEGPADFENMPIRVFFKVAQFRFSKFQGLARDARCQAWDPAQGPKGQKVGSCAPGQTLKLGKPELGHFEKTWIGIFSKYFENRGMFSNYFEKIPPAPPSAAPSGRRRARRRGYFFKIV